MRIERRGSFEITRLQEAVDDAQTQLDRAKARLAPLEAVCKRLDDIADRFAAEFKAAVEALPSSVGQAVIDKHLRDVTQAVSAVQDSLYIAGVDAYRETEAEVIRPLEQALEAAEQALGAAEREQADRDYWRSVA